MPSELDAGLPDWAVANKAQPIPDDVQMPDWASPGRTKLVSTPAEADYVLAVDVSNAAYRAAFAHPDLKGPDGAYSGHVFGTLMELIYKLQHVRAGKWCVAYCYDDPGAKAARRRILPHYKENRDSKVEDPRPAVEPVLRGLTGMHVRAPEREGDDAIAWVVEMCAGEVPVLIVSSDKDTWSLISPTVGVLRPTQNKYVTPDDIEAKFGVRRPDQLALAKSLFGDTGSDNIVGIPRLVKKTVKPYFDLGVTDPAGLYGALEASGYAGLSKAAAAKVAAGRGVVEANFRVASPWVDGFGRDDVDCVSGDRAALDAVLARYGIRSLVSSAGLLVGEEAEVPGAGFGAGWL